MPKAPEIHGSVAAGFEPVRDVFAENFSRRGEVGATFCAYVAGEKVVDLWAGHRDAARKQPWKEDTLAVGFSSTKGIAATALLMLIDRGKLDPEKPVADYWPEFAAAGKENITVSQLLDHRSGLSVIQEKIPVELFADPEKTSEVLARQIPVWAPGSQQGYCATSLGAYAGVLFRKVAGESLGSFIAREIATPLKADFYLGLPPELDARVAEIIPVPTASRVVKALPGILFGHSVEGRIARGVLNRRSATHGALLNPDMGSDPVGRFNDPAIWRMELPWANGITNARALARIYAPLAVDGSLDGTRLVNKDTIEWVKPRRSWEVDAVLRKRLGFSLGYLKEEPHLFSPNSEAFGHAGIGGSLGMADPKTGMSLGYVMNNMDHHLRSPRCITLCQAMYRCL